MALHRDIHWIGRQWAVTGYGMQAIDQRHAGQFDIEITRLWDEDLLERLSEQKWLNPEDFAKGLAIARKRYPELPRSEPQLAPPPRPVETPPKAIEVVTPPHAPGEVAPLPEAVATPRAEPVASKPEKSPPPPAPPEDLLGKWFAAYGLDKDASAVARVPSVAPATLPEVVEPTRQIEPPPTPAPPPVETLLPSSGAVIPPQDATPPAHQMKIPVRARFVRSWRVPIRSVQSYRLWVGKE